jgi:hypothetical protein
MAGQPADRRRLRGVFVPGPAPQRPHRPAVRA